jgi:hypothetical protein
MFRLPNALFRGLHYPFISYSSFLVCVLGGFGLLLGHLLRYAFRSRFIEHNKRTAYNTLQHFLDIFHLIKKLSVQQSRI